MPANRTGHPSMRPVRLRSPFHAVLPAHDHTETIRDDVYTIFEQLDGEEEGSIRSHDNFPVVVALHRGQSSPSQEFAGKFPARPVHVDRAVRWRKKRRVSIKTHRSRECCSGDDHAFPDAINLSPDRGHVGLMSYSAASNATQVQMPRIAIFKLSQVLPTPSTAAAPIPARR